MRKVMFALFIVGTLFQMRRAEAFEAADVDCQNVASNSDGWHRCPWKPYFSVGPSISALSFNLHTKRIGLFDQNAALEVHLSLFQSWVIKGYTEDPEKNTIKKEVHRVSMWELGLGVQVRKDQASGDVTFGAYVIPWGVRVDAFALGVGLSYLTVGAIGNSWDRWSIIIPLTYQLNVG